MSDPADKSERPRLLTRKAAAAYLGISTPTFAKWVAERILPPSIGPTKMWDRKALDFAIDTISGLQKPEPDAIDEFAKWEAAYDAKRARTAAGTSNSN